MILAFIGWGLLGTDEPEYSTASWAAMLFAAGIGIGIIFFGPFEPMTYFLVPRPGSVEPATQEAMKLASAQAALHWGLNAWAVYGMVGLAVAYASWRSSPPCSEPQPLWASAPCRSGAEWRSSRGSGRRATGPRC